MAKTVIFLSARVKFGNILNQLSSCQDSFFTGSRINHNKSMSLHTVSASKSAHGSYVSIFHWLYQFPLQNIHLNFLIFIQHNLKHIHSEYLDVHDIAEARTCYDGLEFEVNSAFNRICKNDSGMHHFI